MTVVYPRAMRILHWVLAILILGMIAVGWRMTSLPGSDPYRMTVYNWHKSIGVVVLILVLTRIFVRRRSTVPPLPERFKAWEKWLAEFTYGVFYVLMAATPLVGFLMTNSYGFPVKFFGLTLPKLIGTDRAIGRALSEVHGYLAYTILALVILHVGAVVKHYVIDRENILKRMWPGKNAG